MRYRIVGRGIIGGIEVWVVGGVEIRDWRSQGRCNLFPPTHKECPHRH